MTETKYQLEWRKLACLYEISHDMRTIDCIDELCKKLIVHMKLIWLPSDQIFPFIDIDKKFFTLDKSSLALEHKFSVSIKTNGKICGYVGLYYKNHCFRHSLENEYLNFIENIADDLGLWLEQKQLLDAKRMLLDEARVFENAFNKHAIIAITDKFGIIKYVNERFCIVSKYSPEELIGQDHRIINSGYHSKDFFFNLWNTISKGDTWKGEIKNRAKDGTYYWVATTIVPFLDDVGVPYQYVAIRTEVTEYKQLEQKMEKQVAELARSNDELEQFAYVVTHDLQEPLRAINSFIQLLKKYCHAQLDQRANDLISHAVAGTQRMQQLIDDLLTYAQVNASQNVVEIDCELLLGNVEADLFVTINECSAIITHDRLPVVKGIRFQFIQLFTNLINNALKFQRAQPPEIHIGVEEKQSEWVFSVSDNGIGIEKEYLERIFRVFQRLHSRKDYAGTGIGLAICKKVVEHHGGRVWVNSKPGVGSSFYFTIPKL
ncbi:sensor histidine kinase [Nitrosomonas supralitoralis]|uniref:histidine kinase n=1 Tax=Nitrosomonas supralitoralis TaxID=2116706 RepID=A0A2P7NSP5_9PROT|nr:PAS domain-containing sensor histidine kinase [Nitrosomonas supralitoralis]PSJ16448.1 PAS domain-containing sensor histidine kinase [Nitrosomonas supralitoralis]